MSHGKKFLSLVFITASSAVHIEYHQGEILAIEREDYFLLPTYYHSTALRTQYTCCVLLVELFETIFITIYTSSTVK